MLDTREKRKGFIGVLVLLLGLLLFETIAFWGYWQMFLLVNGIYVGTGLLLWAALRWVNKAPSEDDDIERDR